MFTSLIFCILLPKTVHLEKVNCVQFQKLEKCFGKVEKLFAKPDRQLWTYTIENDRANIRFALFQDRSRNHLTKQESFNHCMFGNI